MAKQVFEFTPQEVAKALALYGAEQGIIPSGNYYYLHLEIKGVPGKEMVKAILTAEPK